MVREITGRSIGKSCDETYGNADGTTFRDTGRLSTWSGSAAANSPSTKETGQCKRVCASLCLIKRPPKFSIGNKARECPSPRRPARGKGRGKGGWNEGRGRERGTGASKPSDSCCSSRKGAGDLSEQRVWDHVREIGPYYKSLETPLNRALASPFSGRSRLALFLAP